MTSMELEAYKAELACEILTTDSRQVLDEGLKDIKAKRTRPATELLQELRDEL